MKEEKNYWYEVDCSKEDPEEDFITDKTFGFEYYKDAKKFCEENKDIYKAFDVNRFEMRVNNLSMGERVPNIIWCDRYENGTKQYRYAM